MIVNEQIEKLIEILHIYFREKSFEKKDGFLNLEIEAVNLFKAGIIDDETILTTIFNKLLDLKYIDSLPKKSVKYIYSDPPIF